MVSEDLSAVFSLLDHLFQKFTDCPRASLGLNRLCEIVIITTEDFVRISTVLVTLIRVRVRLGWVRLTGLNLFNGGLKIGINDKWRRELFMIFSEH